MTQELGIEYIKSFDRQTKEKARGRRRLLLVDGHNSHYTRGFLEYARLHRIEVVCYPSHGTHVYQGLDVIIFSVLKLNWSDARDDWERDGRTVTKATFLEIYSKAHFLTLTASNVEAAFRSTGIVPFNPDVITAETMAPALETSSTGILPVSQAPAVQPMMDMIGDYLEYRALGAERSGDGGGDGVSERGENAPTPGLPSAATSTATPFFVRSAVDSLAASPSTSFLVSPDPVPSSSSLPAFNSVTISPPRPKRYKHLTDIVPHTEHEANLRAALLEVAGRDEDRKESMKGMQANTILSTMYTKRVRGQLEDQEERKRRKTNGGGLIGDGHAKWFSGDAFFELCVEDDERRKAEAEEKGQRGDERSLHSKALARWREGNDEIRKRNEGRKVQFHAALVEWRAEQEAARAAKRKVAVVQPKLKDFGVEKLLDKPRRIVAGEGGDDGQPEASGSGVRERDESLEMSVSHDDDETSSDSDTTDDEGSGSDSHSREDESESEGEGDVGTGDIDMHSDIDC